MLIMCGGYAWYGAEVLTDKLTQGSGSRSVQDAYPPGTYQDSVIYKVHHSLKGFLAAHSAYIYILVEVEMLLPYLILCLSAYKGYNLDGMVLLLPGLCRLQA